MITRYVVCPESEHFGFFCPGEICHRDQLWFAGGTGGEPEEYNSIFRKNIRGACGYALYIWKYGFGVAHRNEHLIVRYRSYFGEMIFYTVFGGSIYTQVFQEKPLLRHNRVLCGFFERFRFKRQRL